MIEKILMDVFLFYEISEMKNLRINFSITAERKIK